MSKHTLVIMDRSGDREMPWEDADPASVAAVETEYNKLVAHGHAMFKLEKKEGPTKEGSEGAQMKSFDPTAERILAVPAIQGG